jgi:hypothetical protein
VSFPSEKTNADRLKAAKLNVSGPAIFWINRRFFGLAGVAVNWVTP